MSPNTEDIDDILRKLLTSISGVKAVAILSREGLPIASALSREIDEGRIAAMSAAILSVSEGYVREYGIGRLKRILMDTGDESIVLVKKGEFVFLYIIVKL